MKAKLPTTDSEYFDLAYFDSIPAFADFYHETALAGRKGMYRTESGKLVEIGPLAPEVWAEMEFKFMKATTLAVGALVMMSCSNDVVEYLPSGNPDTTIVRAQEER